MDPGQAREREKLQKKLKEPFLKQAPWITDYEKAREEAKKTGKPISIIASASRV